LNSLIIIVIVKISKLFNKQFLWQIDKVINSNYLFLTVMTLGRLFKIKKNKVIEYRMSPCAW